MRGAGVSVGSADHRAHKVGHVRRSMTPASDQDQFQRLVNRAYANTIVFANALFDIHVHRLKGMQAQFPILHCS